MKKIIAALLFVLTTHGQAALPDMGQLLQPSQLTPEGVQALERDANRGDAMAQAKLGFRYLEPVMKSLNPDSLVTARKSMQTLNTSGAFNELLGKGVYWTQKSADAGLPIAQVLMGLCHLIGIGTKLDPDAGWALLKKAALSGDANAQFLLGYAYLSGDGIPTDLFMGVMYMDMAAENGHVEAKRVRDASTNWLEKQFPTPSKSEQFNQYQREAEAGNTDSQYILAEFYVDGRGVNRNEAAALYWYQRAAKQGHKDAALKAAIRHAKGIGTVIDDEQAMYWFAIVANKDRKGVAEAMTDIGRTSASGEGVPRSKDSARQWFTRAAALNSTPAQRELAWIYAQGDGVPQSYELAAQWYEKSAKLGDRVAQYQLATQYIKGQGVAANPETAYFWWLLSSRQKYIGGELDSEGYWDQLPAIQKERQQKLADQWTPEAQGN